MPPVARAASKTESKHPLDSLSCDEIRIASNAVRLARKTPLFFRNVFNLEPPKIELVPFLEAERAGFPNPDTPRPPRRACAQYDVIENDGKRYYMESTIDLATGEEIATRVLQKHQRAAFTVDEFQEFIDSTLASPVFQRVVKDLELPVGWEVAIDPWPYGGSDVGPDYTARLTQLFCFARDMTKGNDDVNHYSYPLPICVVMDTMTRQVLRVERMATGGHDDIDTDFAVHHIEEGHPPPRKPTEHQRSAEYVPEMLDKPERTDFKPLDVVQPQGASFTVTDNGLVQWQKWRFRISFTPRECAVLHDIHYDNRSVVHRLSFSELTVPYCDPRPPHHRKQAFDFGDAGAGHTANNLGLGCDCLGAIKYLDAALVRADGEPSVAKNVICIHEQDDGILWKHTNIITERAVVVRDRKLVIQFILTLGNYEYIFAYHLDLAGGIYLETRPTGIMSPVAIDAGKTSPYGTIVGPGVLAQNHQHIFVVRIDAAIDGHANTVTVEDSLPMPIEPTRNPYSNSYYVESTTIKTSTHIDAAPMQNRVIKISNPSKRNPVSGRPVAYKFSPPATQLLLADPMSDIARRAKYARHHVWVTRHADYEYWAGGEFPSMAREEEGGCFDAAARQDSVEDQDVVVWAVFGFTHSPRVEDWPVMPAERFTLHLRPVDFFDGNPALDVPSKKNLASVLVDGKCGLA
ncbi:copper amine oxidase 1 [Cordyceps javanica]|uniref:Amine oxidase n=1 Tax=Cordyceps javanica TaxID=43265 RepID=A0A545URL6_9HYPO|nr:copper amine oxidase 1 [Cordyceps javanica]TQW04101.1 copper amine oxidase 1 [Cordyceps javanica]